ncbi:MAG: hypothetical protein ABH832_03430 [bacterium]
MAKKIIGTTTKEQLDMEGLLKRLEALEKENELLRQHVDPVDIYGDKIREMTGSSFREIMAEGAGTDWYNYFMGLTLNDMMEILGETAKKAKEKAMKGKRIPRDTQMHYALLAVSEGAHTAKEIKEKYGQFINSPVWSELAKDGYLKKEGAKTKATYAMTAKGEKYMGELAEKGNP